MYDVTMAAGSVTPVDHENFAGMMTVCFSNSALELLPVFHF